MAAITKLFHTFANGVRDAALSENEIRERKETKEILELAKLGAIVAVAVSLLFFAIFPHIINFCLVALTTFAARELYNVADNILEMLNKAVVEASARSTVDSLIEQLTKNTFVVRPIIVLSGLDLSPLA